MTIEGLPQAGGEKRGGVVELKPTFDPTTNFITQEYAEFAESQRARWSLTRFIKVKLDQRRRKRKK